MSEPRIRWQDAGDKIIAWRGSTGTLDAPVFSVLRPTPGYPDWALTCQFAGQAGKARYADDGPGADDRLKAEAERWLEELIAEETRKYLSSRPEVQDALGAEIKEAVRQAREAVAGEIGQQVASADRKPA